jgi:hypothetical protein
MIAFAAALRLAQDAGKRAATDGVFSVRPRWNLAALAG